MRTEGSAYLDRSGRVLVADVTFRTILGLPAGDVSEALRDRARSDPALAALVAGTGPDHAAIAPSGALPACELARSSCDEGMLLRANARDAGPSREEESEPVATPLPEAESAELAIQAIALARLAGSVAHEVKNPLNAMALQLALLGDKIASADERLGDACAANLSSIKNQIGRINEVVRRYVDVADPATAPPGGFDAGGLLADVATLFGHELRRRRVTLRCDAAAGTVRAAGDGVRATRLLLGLVWRAVSQTAAGGSLSVSCAAPAGGYAELVVERSAGEADPLLEWMDAAVASAARELGGVVERTCIDGQFRVALKLPKEATP